MAEARCVGMQVTLRFLTAVYKEKDPKNYDARLINAKIDQLDNGFYVSKVNKPNKNGTSIRLKAIETQEKFAEVVKEIESEKANWKHTYDSEKSGE